ncbi:hypothetical protein VSR34_33630 [Paraburkholderia sp. JHI2823]
MLKKALLRAHIDVYDLATVNLLSCLQNVHGVFGVWEWGRACETPPDWIRRTQTHADDAQTQTAAQLLAKHAPPSGGTPKSEKA